MLPLLVSIKTLGFDILSPDEVFCSVVGVFVWVVACVSVAVVCCVLVPELLVSDAPQPAVLIASIKNSANALFIFLLTSMCFLNVLLVAAHDTVSVQS